KIMLDKLSAARGAVDAREDTRVRGRVDDPIDRGNPFQIARESNVAMANLDAELFQRRRIQVAPWPAKIIQPEDFMLRVALEQSAGKGGPNETANAGDQDLHRVITCCRVLPQEGSRRQPELYRPEM